MPCLSVVLLLRYKEVAKRLNQEDRERRLRQAKEKGGADLKKRNIPNFYREIEDILKTRSTIWRIFAEIQIILLLERCKDENNI